MKIAIASCGLGRVHRGIEAWAADLGRALTERGVEVILCKGSGEPAGPWERVVRSWGREDRRTAVALRLLPKRGLWRLGLSSEYGIEQFSFSMGLLKILRRESIDILHVQDPWVAVVMQWAYGVGLIRACVILAHGTEESIEFQRRITFLQHLAPWHLEESRRGGAWSPAWTAIPNFIDPNVFSPGEGGSLRSELGIPPNAIVIMTSAAIKRQHKRIDYLLQETAALVSRRPDLPVWLVIAGGWESETDDLTGQGRKLLGDRVRFLVRFPRDRMVELYRSADVFVLCSLKEMMPIALLEAGACGLPVVVHRHPVMEWMIGVGGDAIDMTVSGALADHLELLMLDPVRRQHLGTWAREHCVAHFGRDRVVNQILDYYSDVLACQASSKSGDVDWSWWGHRTSIGTGARQGNISGAVRSVARSREGAA